MCRSRLCAGFLVASWLVLAGCTPPPRLDLHAIDMPRPANQAAALERMRAVGERIAHQPFLGGNKVELLVNGPSTYAAMEATIRSASLRIDMESYEFDGVAAERFARLLLAKRAQGIEVHLIYDAYGSRDAPAALFERLRQGGVDVLEVNPLRPNARVPLDLNHRDHRKLLVVDGVVAITGGVNVDGVYGNRPGTHTTDPAKMAWRDTDVRIEGPTVAQFQQIFLQTWREQKGPPLDPPPPTPADRRGKAKVQALDGTPEHKRPLVYDTTLAAISLAWRSVHLTTGYFVPTPELAQVLKRAARRGVDVEIVVPGSSDSAVAMAAGRASYEDLLEAGVRIFERQGEVLHAKTAVIDGTWCTVGSSNLDWRSAVLNNEVNAVVLDRRLGDELEALFRTDLAASREIKRRDWASRPLRERFDEWGARLFQRLL